MQLLEQNDDFFTLRITPIEVLAINNALNESLETFADDDTEFETRMGVTKADVVSILETLSLLWHNGA